jgi:chromosome segregation ATPase
VAEAGNGRRQAEEELARAQERFERERSGLKAHIETLETRLVEAMEQVNNPARTANQIREQVEKRLDEARQQWEAQWEAQWDAQRQKRIAEVDRARSGRDPLGEARRLMRDRIRAKQEGRSTVEENPGSVGESGGDEAQQLRVRVTALERELHLAGESSRQEAFEELRAQYDQKLEQARRERAKLDQDVRSLGEQLAEANQAAASRIRRLEESVDDAEEAARLEATSEVRLELEGRLDQSERQETRLARRIEEIQEERDLERSRLMKQIEELEASLGQARETASKRSSEPTLEEFNRLRWQLQEDFRSTMAAWEEDRASLTVKIQALEESAGNG